MCSTAHITQSCPICLSTDTWWDDDGNVLDLLITAEHSELLGDIDVRNPGCSDHKLVTAELNVGRPSACHCQFTYRNVKVVDPDICCATLNAKSVCTAPADDVNTFADQLDRIITDVLVRGNLVYGNMVTVIWSTVIWSQGKLVTSNMVTG